MISVEYTAGFFDGEGCIYVDPYKEAHYRVRVSISNTNKEVMEAVRERWGGILRLQKPTNPNHNISWHWTIWARDGKPFLEALEPHLIVKKMTAQLALQLLATYKHKFCRYNPVPIDVINKRRALFTQLRRCNTKGRSNFNLAEMSEVSL